MLSVLHEAIEHRLMLPLVIRAPQNQRILHPDTASGEMETSIDESPAEVETLGICVKNVGGTTFFEVVSHVLEGSKQEMIEFFVLHGVILNGQAAGALEGNAIGRVGQNEICLPAIHERGHILGAGGVTAHESVSADSPEVATLHKGGLLQRGTQVVIVIFRVRIAPVLEQVSQFLLVKAGKGDVKSLALQRLDFHPEELFIPTCVHRHAVIGEDVGFFLRLGQVIHKDTGHLGDAFLLGGKQTTVTGDDAIVTVDDDRVDKAEFPQRRAELHDLLRRVRPSIVDIGHQFADGHQLHISRCFHTSPHSANFSKPPTERI